MAELMGSYHQLLAGKAATLLSLSVAAVAVYGCAADRAPTPEPLGTAPTSEPPPVAGPTTVAPPAAGGLQSSPPGGAPTSMAAAGTDPAKAVTLRGWLSIVWNDRPHFFLTGDDGETVEILLGEQLTAPLGGPLALDRSRVIVLAVVAPDAPDVFAALSIQLEAGG